MGFGEFGSNGSLHWKVGHSDDPAVPPLIKGIDPIPKDKIGEGTGGGQAKKHKGYVRVRLRFASASEAREALSVIVAKISAPDADGYHAIIDVPAIKRNKEDDDLPWEVRVDW